MSRRFLNLLVNNRAYNLHRIDAGSLFCPTGWTKQPWPVVDPAKMEHAPLPPAAISFDRPCLPRKSGWMEFMATGSSRNDILALDNEGRAVLYDGSFCTVRTMPTLQEPMSLDSISITVGDRLYVLNAKPCRQAHMHSLFYGRPSNFHREGWYWQSLPTPAFVYADDSEDEEEDYLEKQHPCEISAYTAVCDSQIWISTVGAGTYSFDTVSGEWSKAGDWALPFKGRVEYVPEHNLWFGFSSDEEQLCAADLTADTPVVQKTWKDWTWPKAWIPTSTHLLPLGSGRFCVAWFFHTLDEKILESGYKDKTIESFAVFLGMELVADCKAAGVERLEMIMHKVKRYNFGDTIVQLL